MLIKQCLQLHQLRFRLRDNIGVSGYTCHCSPPPAAVAKPFARALTFYGISLIHAEFYMRLVESHARCSCPEANVCPYSTNTSSFRFLSHSYSSVSKLHLKNFRNLEGLLFSEPLLIYIVSVCVKNRSLDKLDTVNYIPLDTKHNSACLNIAIYHQIRNTDVIIQCNIKAWISAHVKSALF